MSEQDKPFVINDRRKFRMDGEPRDPLPADAAESAEAAGPVAVSAPEKQDAPASGPIPIRQRAYQQRAPGDAGS